MVLIDYLTILVVYEILVDSVFISKTPVNTDFQKV